MDLELVSSLISFWVASQLTTAVLSSYMPRVEYRCGGQTFIKVQIVLFCVLF